MRNEGVVMGMREWLLMKGGRVFVYCRIVL